MTTKSYQTFLKNGDVRVTRAPLCFRDLVAREFVICNPVFDAQCNKILRKNIFCFVDLTSLNAESMEVQVFRSQSSEWTR